ncbi:MAG: lantibiotic dehydratase [Frankiaceae bacterium]
MTWKPYHTGMARFSAAAMDDVPRPRDDIEPLDLIRHYAQDPVVMEAVEVASPTLGATLQRVMDGEELDPRRVARAALALMRYLVRRSTRATPFGLLAVVGIARLSGESSMDSASAGLEIGPHQRWVRVDLGWLRLLVGQLSSDLEGLRLCNVLLSNLVRVEQERLYVETVGADGVVTRVGLRLNAALTVVLQCTRTATPFAELAVRLSRLAPEPHDLRRAETFLQALIAQQVLLTDLAPSFTEPEPLAHLAARASRMHPDVAAQLAVADQAVKSYAVSHATAAVAQLRAARASLGRLQASDHSLHIDAAVPDIALPPTIASSAQMAAEVLWKLTPIDVDAWPLRDYFAQFVERFGTEQAVPVKALVDPARGLGLPAPYTPGNEREHRSPTPRDVLLAELGQTAAAEGRALQLMGSAIDELVAATGGATGHPPDWLELIVSVLAPTLEAVRRGEFELLVHHTSGARAPGSMMARFGYMFPGVMRSLIADMTDAVRTTDRHVQLLAHAHSARMDNIMRVGVLRESVLTVASAWAHELPEALDLDDVAVCASQHGLYLYSFEQQNRIRVSSHHMLSRSAFQSPVARLLLDISAIDEQRWSPFRWDAQAISRMFLPEVRYGNIILSSAKWRPPREMRGRSVPWDEWARLFRDWRAAYDVPDRVQLRNNDHTLDLDLASALHLRLFRDELRKSPGTLVTTSRAYDEHDVGWSSGRMAEIVVPLHRASASTAERKAEPRPLTRQAHLPGSEWLYVKAYVPSDSQDEVLCRHFSPFLAELAPVISCWFFVRYRDPEPHLRLRFRLTDRSFLADALQALHRWGENLVDAGLVRTLQLDTYEPEIARYGGSTALPLAEQWFSLDSTASLEMLKLRRRGGLRVDSIRLAVLNGERILETFANDAAPARHLRNEIGGAEGNEWRRVKEQHVAWRKHARERDLCNDEASAARLCGAWAERRAGGERLLEQEPRLGHWPVVRSFLHMAHNRLVGLDAAHERLSNRVLAEVWRHRWMTTR